MRKRYRGFVGASGELDAHPVVRQHFGDELKRAAPDAFREANLRLYHYYRALPEKEQPDTLPEMQPLFHAIAHGCAAGLHQEVFDEVYWERVLRKKDYVKSQLGAFSADLGALAHFFDPPWSAPHASLTEPDQGAALNHAAIALRSLGRLRDATEPMGTGAMLDVSLKDWKSAAADYSNLSELRLTLGDIAAAVEAGREAVAHADTSGDAFQRMGNCTTLADALHQAGVVPEAERLFREAEAMQAERQPSLDRLYSLQGYRFCDLLLGQGQVEEVRERATYAIQVARENGWLLDTALDTLSLGRAAHALAFRPLPMSGAKWGEGSLADARRALDVAVERLRNAGLEDYICRGLLARAAFRRDAYLAGLPEGDLAGAQEDLTEAHEIAHRGGMRLHLTDYYLEWGRLVLAHDPKLAHADSRRHAETCWEAARNLINETGYHRRDTELAALRAAIDAAGTS